MSIKVMYIAMLVLCVIAFVSYVVEDNGPASVWCLNTAIWVVNTRLMWSNSEYWRKKFHDTEAEAWKKNRDKFQNGGYRD